MPFSSSVIGPTRLAGRKLTAKHENEFLAANDDYLEEVIFENGDGIERHPAGITKLVAQLFHSEECNVLCFSSLEALDDDKLREGVEKLTGSSGGDYETDLQHIGR